MLKSEFAHEIPMLVFRSIKNCNQHSPAFPQNTILLKTGLSAGWEGFRLNRIVFGLQNSIITILFSLEYLNSIFPKSTYMYSTRSVYSRGSHFLLLWRTGLRQVWHDGHPPDGVFGEDAAQATGVCPHEGRTTRTRARRRSSCYHPPLFNSTPTVLAQAMPVLISSRKEELLSNAFKKCSGNTSGSTSCPPKSMAASFALFLEGLSDGFEADGTRVIHKVR